MSQPNTRDIENARIVAWLREARAGFKHDPADNDFQRGYAACIELALTEGATPAPEPPESA